MLYVLDIIVNSFPCWLGQIYAMHYRPVHWN